jgi:hypothetical protein
LPDDLRSLVRRQAEQVEFRTFGTDVERLIKKLRLDVPEVKPISAVPKVPVHPAVGPQVPVTAATNEQPRDPPIQDIVKRGWLGRYVQVALVLAGTSNLIGLSLLFPLTHPPTAMGEIVIFAVVLLVYVSFYCATIWIGVRVLGFGKLGLRLGIIVCTLGMVPAVLGLLMAIEYALNPRATVELPVILTWAASTLAYAPAIRLLRQLRRALP